MGVLLWKKKIKKSTAWREGGSQQICGNSCVKFCRSKLKWLLMKCLVDTRGFEIQNLTIPTWGNWGTVLNLAKVAKQVNGQGVTILGHGLWIHSEKVDTNCIFPCPFPVTLLLPCTNSAQIPCHKFICWAANKLRRMEGTEEDVLAEFFSCPLL